jgi:Protein of unknown function DUF262
MSTAVPKPSPSGAEPAANRSTPSVRRGSLADEKPMSRRVPILKLERSILEMHRRKAASTLDLRRGFRSDLAWSSVAQSRLVESVLLRIPLPAIHVAEARDGSMRIIDGLQRLTSLFRFLEGNLALEKLGLLPELDDKRFRDLDIRMRRRYEDSPLTVMILGAGADPSLAVDLYNRMNSWAPLREDEARGLLGAQDLERDG